jgi:hypothetical protein
MSKWKSAIQEQLLSNSESWSHKKSFASHRAQITALAVADGPHESICILGAGNCSDLDLDQVAVVFGEVHLVDIDGAALERAKSSVSKHLAPRIKLHPHTDLSGLETKLERWGRMQVTPEEMMEYPEDLARDLRLRLGSSFDRVLSVCLLSQLHLVTRRVLSEQHPLTAAVTFCLNLAHLRTLLALTRPDGLAFLVTDVSSNEIAPMDEEEWTEPLLYLDVLLKRFDVFQAVDPRVLAAVATDDPVLGEHARLSEPQAAWVWQNGPERRFLVYAATLTPSGLSESA